MFKKFTGFLMLCLFATGVVTSSSSVSGQDISAADVTQEQAWKLGNGKPVKGMLELSSPGFVTILANTKQQKIRRSDLTDAQQKIFKLLDQEITDLRKSIAPDYIKMASNGPDPKEIRQFQAQLIAASKVTPELTMIEELHRLELVHQAQLILGPIVRSGKRQYFAFNDKLYLTSKTVAFCFQSAYAVTRTSCPLCPPTTRLPSVG